MLGYGEDEIIGLDIGALVVRKAMPLLRNGSKALSAGKTLSHIMGSKL